MVIHYGIMDNGFRLGAQEAVLKFFSDTLAERLKDAVDETGLTQEDFALRVLRTTGMPMAQSRVSKLTKGKYEPSLREIEALAATLKLNPGWLAFEQGRMHARPAETGESRARLSTALEKTEDEAAPRTALKRSKRR